MLAVITARSYLEADRQSSEPGLLIAQGYVGKLAAVVTRFRDSTGHWPESLADLPRPAVREANATLSDDDENAHLMGGTPDGRGRCGRYERDDCLAYDGMYLYHIDFHCCEVPVEGPKTSSPGICSSSTVPVFTAKRYNRRRYYWNWQTSAWQTKPYSDNAEPDTTTWFFSAPNDSTAWGAASTGIYAVTTDGGRTCRVSRLPKAASLGFVALDAVTPDVVLLLGTKDDGMHIYKTVDAGATWEHQFGDHDLQPVAVRFWNADHGLALATPRPPSDEGARAQVQWSALDQVVVLRTNAGGKTWERVTDLPPALPGERALAGSLTTFGDGRAWFGTRAKTGQLGRVFRTTDGGRTWSAADTPAQPSDGIDQIAFRDTLHGIAVSCGYQLNSFVMRTSDGGQSWSLVLRTDEWRARCYELAYVATANNQALLMHAHDKIRYSLDEGTTWMIVDPALYRDIASADPWRAFVTQAGWTNRWLRSLPDSVRRP